MEKKKVNVKIFGNDYTMVGVESEDYIHRVAYQVDKKMREISEANPKLGTSMVAVLVAVNAVLVCQADPSSALIPQDIL